MASKIKEKKLTCLWAGSLIRSSLSYKTAQLSLWQVLEIKTPATQFMVLNPQFSLTYRILIKPTSLAPQTSKRECSRQGIIGRILVMDCFRLGEIWAGMQTNRIRNWWRPSNPKEICMVRDLIPCWHNKVLKTKILNLNQENTSNWTHMDPKETDYRTTRYQRFTWRAWWRLMYPTNSKINLASLGSIAVRIWVK